MENILHPLCVRASFLGSCSTKVLSQTHVALMVQTLGNAVIEVPRVVFVLVTLHQRLSDLLIKRDWRFSLGHRRLPFVSSTWNRFRVFMIEVRATQPRS
jgi:hypothetical protein